MELDGHITLSRRHQEAVAQLGAIMVRATAALNRTTIIELHAIIDDNLLNVNYGFYLGKRDA